MKKVLIGVAVLLVVVIGAAVWFVTQRLDSFVASLIEQQGTAITGTAVRVGGVDIDLRAGRGSIRGLRVANPSGYSGSEAFTLGEITLDIDLASITSSPIGIDELVVGAPEANFEVDARGRSNFQVIKSNVDRYTAGSGAAEEPTTAAGEPMRLRISRFRFEDGRVRADISALDVERDSFDAKLPSLRLGDVSGTPGEIGKTVITAFTTQVAKTVAAQQGSRYLEDRIGGEAGKAVGETLRRFLE